MGIKQGKIRLHLWFWLSHSSSDAEMKGWLQNAPVDLALFNPAQPHFTAKPIFIGDAEDPMPGRSGIYKTSMVSPVQTSSSRGLLENHGDRTLLRVSGILDNFRNDIIFPRAGYNTGL